MYVIYSMYFFAYTLYMEVCFYLSSCISTYLCIGTRGWAGYMDYEDVRYNES